ncbi:hypothetical protein HanIR_Chr08g0349481 [Helianthus annuus]|nr:hypothetical protein HanIR_Chr08g0349481 [Helianthus annuus]
MPGKTVNIGTDGQIRCRRTSAPHKTKIDVHIEHARKKIIVAVLPGVLPSQSESCST